MNRRQEFTWCQLYWSRWFVLKGEDAASVHMEGISQELQISLNGWAKNTWVLFAFPPFGQHVMSIVEVHG